LNENNPPLNIPSPQEALAKDISVPEVPFGIREIYWKAGLILFTLGLMLASLITLMAGTMPSAIGTMYVIPAILFAYFYRRKGVLIVYLVAMFYFTTVVLFRYPSADDIFAAVSRSVLLVAVALIVSYLTAHLIREKRKYKAIFENTENGVLLVSLPDLRILEMNERFARSLNISAPLSVGSLMDVFITNPDLPGRMLADLHTFCSTPAMEIVMRRSDGSEWVAVVASRKIAAEVAVMTFIDITERRNMELQLQRLNEDANLYLDILTHDINNINTASLNYGHLLLGLPGMGKEPISGKLIRSLDKSDEIIRNVSTLRKMREIPARSRLRLGDVIRQVIEGFPDTRIEYGGGDELVLADEMLSSVFGNLIGNCIKYAGPDPVIAIRITPREMDVLVSIEDHGPGIPDSLKSVVFDRFQRGDATVSGRGLGLFICRTLVERYGGSIRAEDRVPGDPSQGAAIRFTLPRE
jgi:signal transduction histidine kinase